MDKLLFAGSHADIYGEDFRSRYGKIEIYEAHNPKFQVGDIVSIKDEGEMYSNYLAMAHALNVPGIGRNSNFRPQGRAGEIHASGRHENKKVNVYAVKEPNGNYFLIGEDGLQLKKKKPIFAEELFEI